MDWNKRKISVSCPCVSLLDLSLCMRWIDHAYFALILVHGLNLTHGSWLKPQDSFDEFDIFFLLDLQKVQEIIRKHHQTFLQLFWMTYCNAILPSGKLSLCTYVTYGKVFGGTPNIFMFGLFPENGSISERTVNRTLIVHTTL